MSSRHEAQRNASRRSQYEESIDLTHTANTPVVAWSRAHRVANT